MFGNIESRVINLYKCRGIFNIERFDQKIAFFLYIQLCIMSPNIDFLGGKESILTFF